MAAKRLGIVLVVALYSAGVAWTDTYDSATLVNITTANPDETCFDNLPSPTLVDAEVPAPDTGFWYLSRGRSACGLGTYGARSDGSPRETTTCP